MIRNNPKKGFTLLEALVAVSVLMVAVAAPMTIAQKGLSSAVYTKNQMIASYLAQDAVEYVKNKRDEITLGHKKNNGSFDWKDLDYFEDCKAELGCQIDTISGNVKPYSDDIPLKKDANNFYQYEYSTNGETNFTRKVLLTIKGDEALITVTVRWGLAEEKVEVNTLIFNY